MRLWIVGQLLPPEEECFWQFVGVFDSQELADKNCTTTDHFYGPAELNENVGEALIDWPDSFYPRAIEQLKLE